MTREAVLEALKTPPPGRDYVWDGVDDHHVLDAFRSGGPGWQSRMNAALREWLKTHQPR